MFSGQTEENIVNVLGESLQDTAFLFSDPVYDEEVPEFTSWDATAVKLSFKGDNSGTFYLVADYQILRLLAENLLGIETDSEDAIPSGVKALKEILNIFLGNFLTREFGVQKIYDLGIPEELESIKSLDDKVKIWMDIEGFLLCIIPVIE